MASHSSTARHTLEAFEALSAALRSELADGGAQRQSLRGLDTEAMLDRARARSNFNGRFSALLTDVNTRLAALCAEHGIQIPSVASLADVDPELHAVLAAARDDAQALGRALKADDGKAHALAARALEAVNAAVQKAPAPPQAYGRRGQAYGHTSKSGGTTRHTL